MLGKSSLIKEEKLEFSFWFLCSYSFSLLSFQAGNLEREYEDFEQKRLDNVRKFHEALQDVVAKDLSREGDRDIYRAYNIPPNRLDIGGLFAKARRDPVETTDDSP